MTNDSKSHHNFIASHLLDIPRSGIRDFFEIVSKRKNVISLGIGEPNFITPWHIREASIFAIDRGATSYTSNLGLVELRSLISEYVRKNFHVNYDHEKEIIITVGVSEALDLALRAIIESGDEIIYCEPSYVSYNPLIILAGGKPVAVKTSKEDAFQPSVHAIESAITPKTKAILLNSPNNPTGAVINRENAAKIAELAVKYNLLIISDEIYTELTYDTEPFSILSFPGIKERGILLNGFSKAWAMTGYRVGFACAPSDIIEAMMKIHQYTMLCASTISQKAAIEALRNGDAEKKEMIESYRQRRQFIWESLNEIGLSCHKPDGAFYAFPYIGDYGMKSKDFCVKLLEEENVACVPGTAFGNAGEGFIRCSFAAEFQDIKEAMKRIGRFVKKLK